MRLLKQSTSIDLPIGPFLDPADAVTPESALTLTQPDIRLKKNGGAWAQKAAAQTLTHEENGNYELTLDATDTDTLGLLRVHVAESGALPVWEDFMVMPANVWDSLFGADRLQVDVLELGSATQSATDLKDFADDGYDPSTNKVQGVVLTDTVTTYTGNTVQTGDAYARIGANGAGLSALPWNASWDAEVQSEAEDALVVHRLDELVNADSDIDGAAPPTVGSVFHELMSKTAGSFTFDQTTDSQEAIRDRGDAAWVTGTTPPTAAASADAVWDEDATGHQTQGTFGQAIGDPGADTDTLFGLVNTNLNATVSSRSSHSVADIWNEIIDAYEAGTAGGRLKAIFDNVGALLTRLPAGLFTGLTNFAQWLGALAGKQAANSTAQTEIRATGAGSGTYDATTDSQEALRDNIGTAGAGLTAHPWPAAWDAEVQSEVQDALEANHLDHLLAADYDPAAKPGVATALLNELVESDGGVSRYTANALEQAPTGGSAPTAVQIRQEIDANSTKLDAAVSTRATPTQVNAEVLDVLTVDTFAEPSAVPAATSTLKDKLNWLFILGRNKRTQTSTTELVRNDGDSATVGTSTKSDDLTTFVKGKYT
jgi:hypothetical protein